MTTDLPALYPLRFREILRAYSFGGRWIPRAFAKDGLPEDHPISETWEVCDRPGESSEVMNGPLKGVTLGDAVQRYGDRLLGKDICSRFGGRFPLLIKLLDATHELGEQCHPNDDLTREWNLEDFSGKTEGWYMLRTTPGAPVFCGNRAGVSRDELLTALRQGGARSCMAEYAARPGDAFLLYAGTMHYSPGGLLFYEIMQNSDVFVGLGPMPPALSAEEREERVRRAATAVHLEEGFDCRTVPITIPCGRNRRTFVMACDKFALERLDLIEPAALALDGERFAVLTAIEGKTVISHPGWEGALLPGQTCLLPACLADVKLAPVAAASLLKASVPDLVKDVVQPLLDAGIDAESIRGLGGRTRLNALTGLL